MTSTNTASWQNPKPLRNALTTWACRDDTRDDPKARAAADTALAAIADTIAELAGLGLRLEREIVQAEDDRGYHEAAELDHAEQTAIAGDGRICAAERITVTGLLRCVLPPGHAPALRHVDADGLIFGDSGDVYLAAADAEAPAADESFVCCSTPLRWPARDVDVPCPDCGTIWERQAADLGAGAQIKGARKAQPESWDLAYHFSDMGARDEADDDTGYHDACELDGSEQIVVARGTRVVGPRGPGQIVACANFSNASTVRYDAGGYVTELNSLLSLSDDGPLSGSQLAVLQASHGVSVTRCVHGYFSCPLCDEIVEPPAPGGQDAPGPAPADDWSDEELAALPPMFPPLPPASCGHPAPSAP